VHINDSAIDAVNIKPDCLLFVQTYNILIIENFTYSCLALFTELVDKFFLPRVIKPCQLNSQACFSMPCFNDLLSLDYPTICAAEASDHESNGIQMAFLQ